MAIIGGLYALLVVKLFNRINLAIGFVKASSRVVKVLNQLNIVPLVAVFFSIFAASVTLISCLNAMSIGKILTLDSEKQGIF